MANIFAMLLFAVLTFSSSIQDEGKGVSQPKNANAAHNDAKQKKNMPPPAAPVPCESKVDQPTIQYNQTNEGEAAKPVHSGIDFLNAISTAVVGLFTIVLGIVGILQFRATKTAERAWIVPDIQFPPVERTNGGIECLNHFLNKGRTPGWVTAMGSSGQILRAEDQLPPEPTYRTMAGPFPIGGNVLPPNAYTRQGIPLSAQEWASMQSGEYAFYFFGFVTYRDIFGAEHLTRYCFRYKPGPTEADPAPRDFYVAGPEPYNRAT